MTRKKVKDVTALNAKGKGLGLKWNVEYCKHECVNEHVGLATCEDKLPALFDEFKNERMLWIILLEREMCLDSRKHVVLVLHINHSCWANCYVEKWEVQYYLWWGEFSKHIIKQG